MDIKSMVLEGRLFKMKEVLKRKQRDLVVFLDRVRNYHNASAILRTCDAVGVLYVYYSGPSYLPINTGISLGAERWLEVEKVEDAELFLNSLKNDGYAVYVTHLGEGAKDFRKVDYTGKTVVVFGNEKEGVSDGLLSLATDTIKIPMVGMVRSLNVSVSAGVILYEAMKQRESLGLYDKPSLSDEEMESILHRWIEIKLFKRKRVGSAGFG